MAADGRIEFGGLEFATSTPICAALGVSPARRSCSRAWLASRR
jgi:hypothetical protein